MANPIIYNFAIFTNTHTFPYTLNPPTPPPKPGPPVVFTALCDKQLASLKFPLQILQVLWSLTWHIERGGIEGELGVELL